LWFLASAGLVEGQVLIWRSLDADPDMLRDRAIEACLLSHSRGVHIDEHYTQSVWNYFLDQKSANRSLALELLWQLGELTKPLRLHKIIDSDQDSKLREQAKRLLDKLE
jgi:hypothetical protein